MTNTAKHLAFLTGLVVTKTYDKAKGHWFFEFFSNGDCVHSVYDYKKAKQFAEGIRVGRLLEGQHVHS